MAAELPAATLIGLVEQYSPTGSTTQAVGWLVDRMKSLGFERAFADPVGNAVGIMGEGARQVVLLGHIDTVTGEIPVRVDGNLLYARGSVDAKGPLAAFADAVARCGRLDGWQLVVVGAMDEEADSWGARSIISTYHPEFAIIGEPSRWDRVTLGYKGSAWADIVTRRTLAHTASQAESACEAAVALWQGIKAWAESYNEPHEKAFDKLLLTLRGWDSGSDGFEEWACLHIGARLPVEMDPPAWFARLRALVDEAAVEETGFPVPAYLAEKNTPLVRAFLAGIRSQGGAPGFVVKTGTSDMNLVAPAWGCPAVAYGPGDSSLDHTPDEHTSLDDYVKSVAVLSETIRKLCGETPR